MKHEFWRRFGALMLSLVMALTLAATPAMAADVTDPDPDPGPVVPDPGPTPVESITLSDATLTLTVDGTAALTATVSPDNATDPSVTWSSDNTGVADVDQNGNVTAVSAGTATITVAANDGSGKSASCRVTVNAKPIPATSVTVSPSTLNLTVGGTGSLTATVSPESATDRSVRWSSDNATIATVNATSGTVTGVNVGTTTIKATANGGTDVVGECVVTVTAAIPSLNSIGFSTPIETLSKGETKTIALTVDAAGADVSSAVWTCADETVVKVAPNANGAGAKLTGVAPGQTTITVKVGDLTAELTVRVSGIVIELNGEPVGSSFTVIQRDTVTLTARPYGNATGQVNWESSSNGVAMITSGGRVTGVTLGTATITATIGNEYIASCTVAVVEDTSGQINAGSVKGGGELSLNSATIRTQLNRIAAQKGYGSVDYITSLSVATDQGTLYYTYVYEGDTGAGVGSEKYYLSPGNGQLALSNLSFVPKADFSGSADIRYTAWCGSRSFSGVIRVTVSAITDVTYSTAVNTEVGFLSSDFNAVCRNKNNRDMKYVTFTLPQETAGTLYYNYTNASNSQTVTAGTQYYRTSSPYLDEITFVPAATCPSVVYISYQGVDTANQSFSGRVAITVSGGQGSSTTVTSRDVVYTADWGQQVIFRATDFAAACQANTGEALSYVQFSLPGSAQGTLYLNYNSTSGTGTLVSTATNFYYSSAPAIGGVSFVPSASVSSRVVIPYTGYSIRGATYTGSVYISYSDSTNPTVRYTTYSGKLVGFQVASFNNACLAATGYSLDYVEFSGVPSDAQGGVMYYRYNANSTYNTQVYNGTRYYRTGSNLNLLSQISFLAAKSYTGSVTIPYTGYSVTNANGIRSSFTGTVVIQVAAPAPNDINLSTTVSAPVQLSSSTLRIVCNAVMDQELSYILITGLPDSSAGALYSNYSVAGTGTQVTIGSRFYRAGSPGIDQLSFVPKSGYRGTVVISYTGVSTTGQQVSGRINIRVGSTGTSGYFNDMSSYAWAADAVDYLYRNGVVNGMGGGAFGPALSIRRCDFVVMLCRAFRLTGGSGYSFADVPTNSYYADAVATAKNLGIVSGDGTNFRPNDNLSRQDAMVMIYNTLKATGHSMTNGLTADLTIFLDHSQVSPYALNAVGILVYMGAVKGDGTGYLHPWSAINRAEAAVLIHFIMTE